MTTNYRYQEPSKPILELLSPGEYEFTVLESEPPKLKETTGNFVMAVKLSVGPQHKHVYDYPWSGESGDKIAGFLKSCNRAPEPGKEPNWSRIVGAKGRCRIKVEPAKGDFGESNKVSYYVFAKDVKEGAPQSFTPSQVASGEISTRKAAHDPDLDPTEPDSIPF